MVWVDATLLCVSDIPKELYSQKFWSVKGNYLSGLAYNARAFTYDCKFGQVYLLGGTSNRLYSYTRQMLEYYYSIFDTNFTYFMTYVFIEYLYKVDKLCNDAIDMCIQNNTHIEYLTTQRYRTYSELIKSKILSKDTQMYKLSTRIDYDYNDTSTILAHFVNEFS